MKSCHYNINTSINDQLSTAGPLISFSLLKVWRLIESGAYFNLDG